MSLNAMQKSQIRDYLYFPIDSICTSPIDNPNIASKLAGLKLAKLGLEAIFDDHIYEINHYQFKLAGILDEIDQIRLVVKHPSPQNRSTGDYMSVGQEHGMVAWLDHNDLIPYKHTDGSTQYKPKVKKETTGLLSLTARNDESNIKSPVTKDDVLGYMHELIKQKDNQLVSLIEEEQNKNPHLPRYYPLPELPEEITFYMAAKFLNTKDLIRLRQSCKFFYKSKLLKTLEPKLVKYFITATHNQSFYFSPTMDFCYRWGKNCREPKKIILPGNRKVTAITSNSDEKTFLLTEDGEVFIYDFENQEKLLYRLIPKNSKFIAMAMYPPPYSSLNLLLLAQEGKVYKCKKDDNNKFSLTLLPLPNDNETVISISSGWDHSLLLTNTGAVYAFGKNDHGQLGITDKSKQQRSPIKIELPKNEEVVSISAGMMYSLLLTKKGNVYSFGYNGENQLGLNHRRDQFTPVKITIPGISVRGHHFVAISAGCRHSLLLSKNGHVYSCGANNSGQLGLNLDEYYPNVIQKIKFPNQAKITAISAGGHHSLFLIADGYIYGCGSNLYNQLGLRGWSERIQVPKETHTNLPKCFNNNKNKHLSLK